MRKITFGTILSKFVGYNITFFENLPVLHPFGLSPRKNRKKTKVNELSNTVPVTKIHFVIYLMCE